MFHLIVSILQFVLPIAIPSAIMLYLFFIHLPNMIQLILNDVGESMGEQLRETFAEPNVKKAFSILGKKSGEVRGDNALREKFADKAVENMPSINFLLEQFGLTPVEGLKLMNDPLIAPIIQGFLSRMPQNQGSSGQQNLLPQRNRLGRM